MNFFRVWVSALVIIGFGVGAGQASALDAQRPLHHSRLTEPHLTETHRSAHRASAKAARRSTTAHAGATHASRSHTAARGRATVRRVSYTHRHHHYYERFTASSFAKRRHLRGRHHGRRRSGCPPGRHRRPGRHERHRRGHRPLQRPHPGHGQPEAGSLARRRALLHHQDHRGHGRALRRSRHPRHAGPARRLPHEHDPGAGQEQQPLF